jgi:tetratricopeptide (TPR) repeat protein
VWSRLSVLPGPLDLELATVAAGPEAAAALLELVARGLVVHEEGGLRLLFGAARFGAARLDHPEQVAQVVAQWLADGEIPTVTRAPGPSGDRDFATRWRRLFPWAFEAIRVAHPALAAALVLRWSPWLVHMAPSATSRVWLERGVQAARRGEVPLVESVLRLRRVSVLLQAGDLPSVDAELDVTDAIAAASGCRWLRSRTGTFRGHVAHLRSDLDGASQHLRTAAEHARAAGVRWLQARAESNLAHCRLEVVGDAEEAVALQRSALDLVRDGPSEIRGSVRLKLSDALRRAGRLDEALDVARAAMRDLESHGAIDTRLGGFTWLGILLVEAGRAVEALEVLRAAALDAEVHGLRSRLAWVVGALGNAQHVAGELDAAKQTLQRAWVLARQEGLRRAEVQVEFNLALLCWERGEGEAALLHARAAEQSESLLQALAAAVAAGVLSWLGRTAEAAEGWAALRQIEWPQDMRLSVRLLEAFQELGHLRELVEVGDLSRVEAVRQQLLARADEPDLAVPDAWVAARILRAAVREATAGLRPPLRVSADRTLVVTPDDARIDLSRRGPMRRLLDALVGAHRDTPGRTLDLDALFEAGWPGQQAAGTSGHARVYVAVSTLRKLGLADVLQTVDDGYRLDPEVHLLEVSDREA